MTVRLSHHKVSRILGCYFRGMPQPQIAKKLGVDQSTVSVYASRFRERVDKEGLAAAGKEFEVFNEVDSLRSLAVELSNGRLTVEEAKQGLHIVKLFVQLGVSPDQHATLVQVCGEVDDPDFVAAALKLSRLEKDAGASYEQVVSWFQELVPKLKSLTEQVEAAQSELNKTRHLLRVKKQELRRIDEQLIRHRKRTKHKKAELDKELKNKMAQFDASAQEVEQLSKLKAQMAEAGVTLSTLLQLAKEFRE